MNINIAVHYHSANVAVAMLLYRFIDANKDFLAGLDVSFTNHIKSDPLSGSLPLLYAEVTRQGKRATMTDSAVFELFMQYAILQGFEVQEEVQHLTQIDVRYRPENVAVAVLLNDIIDKNKDLLPNVKVTFQSESGPLKANDPLLKATVVSAGKKIELEDSMIIDFFFRRAVSAPTEEPAEYPDQPEQTE